MGDGRRLALVVNTGHDEYQRQLVRGAQSVLAQRGLTLVLNSLNYSERGIPEVVEELIRKTRPYGVLATACQSLQEDADLVRLIGELRLPAVRIGVRSPGLSYVGGESRTGMRDLMAHLLDELGIRRPVFVRGVQHQPDAILRERIFREELTRRGLAVDEGLMIDGSFWHEVAYAEMSRLLGTRRDFDAVVAANDLSAQGALKALVDEGVRVPDDVLLTGFDHDSSALTWPPLTTVDPGLWEQGVAAATELLAQVDGRNRHPEVVIPSRLLVQGSTGTGGGTVGEQQAAGEAARIAHEQLAARDALWGLSRELNHSGDLSEVADAMAGGQLQRLGISRCFLAVYTDADRPEPDGRMRARLLLDLRDGVVHPVPEQDFALGDLLPPALRPELERGLLIFQPIAVAQRQLGYLLVEQGAGWSQVCEGLRMYLSRTLEALFTNQALRRQARELEAAVVELRSEAEERRRTEAQLRLSSTAFQQAADGIVILDSSGLVQSTNPAFSAITGFAARDLVGRSITELTAGPTAPGHWDAIFEALRTTGNWEGELQYRRAGGGDFAARIGVAAVGALDRRPEQFVVTCSDLTEARLKDEHIQRLAFHDGLTGLPNRALLTDRLTQAMAVARRQRGCTGVIYVDLDRFQHVNDSFGHETGNQVLRITADRLQDFVRQSDTVARVGPDEFVVVCTQESGPEELSLVARRMIAQLTQAITVDGTQVRLGASLGVASFPDDGQDAAELLRQAEAAMRSAKEAGGSQHRFFRREMTERTQRQLQLELQLREALATGGLELYYQPKISLRDGALLGAEALVRWNHPERGLLPPAEFIPLAEERGLIGELGAWVLNEACRQAGAWRREPGRVVPMSVNLAAAQARQGDLVKEVLDACARHEIEPADLELELTETGLMDNFAEVVPTFSGLRAAGVTVAVDDFGTGHSGFAYLRDLPVDVLKIDRSFVMHLETRQQDRDILETILTLARALRLDVVAEGVETRFQADLLRSLHCRTAQGYLFARPLPAEQFRDQFLLD
jgi:diguanylate cyclase (GGDEF)-like protein/PAS domain S-box-containing protein